MFLAAAAAAWAVSGALRARLHPEAKPLAGAWHGAATLAAALGAAAIFQKLEHEWLLAALLVEAEAFYLAGLRFKAGYLRALAIPLFALQLIYLTAAEAPQAALSVWAPMAALTAAVLYLNRALCAADKFYGFAAAGVAALIGGYAAPQRESGAVWFVMAIGPFVLGWWRRMADFRWQGYVLGSTGGGGYGVYPAASGGLDRHRRGGILGRGSVRPVDGRGPLRHSRTDPALRNSLHHRRRVSGRVLVEDSARVGARARARRGGPGSVLLRRAGTAQRPGLAELRPGGRGVRALVDRFPKPRSRSCPAPR